MTEEGEDDLDLLVENPDCAFKSYVGCLDVIKAI